MYSVNRSADSNPWPGFGHSPRISEMSTNCPPSNFGEVSRPDKHSSDLTGYIVKTAIPDRKITRINEDCTRKHVQARKITFLKRKDLFEMSIKTLNAGKYKAETTILPERELPSQVRRFFRHPELSREIKRLDLKKDRLIQLNFDNLAQEGFLADENYKDKGIGLTNKYHDKQVPGIRRKAKLFTRFEDNPNFVCGRYQADDAVSYVDTVHVSKVEKRLQDGIDHRISAKEWNSAAKPIVKQVNDEMNARILTSNYDNDDYTYDNSGYY